MLFFSILLMNFRLTEINDGKKKVIGELNDKIKQEMEKQEHDVYVLLLLLLLLLFYLLDRSLIYFGVQKVWGSLLSEIQGQSDWKIQSACWQTSEINVNDKQ